MKEDFVFGFTFQVINKVTRSGPKIRKELDLLFVSVDRLRKISSQKIQVDGLTTFAQGAKKAGVEARRLRNANRSLGTEMVRLRNRSRQGASGIRTLHTAMTLFSAARLFSGLRRGISGVGRAFLDVVKIGSEFDRQMVFSSQVMGASGREAAMLRAEAKRLGATTSFTAREAAKGFLVLGQAGYNARDSINLLDPAVKLAGAGMVSLEKATEVTSDAIKVYGLGTKDARKVTDVLTAGFTSSSQSLLQLKDGLRQAGPVAAAAGRSLKETVAVLGLFANQGFRGSKGGVALRNILAQIQTPNKNLAKSLKFLGLSMDDINPKTNSLATIFKRLEPLAKRSDLTFKLFGKRTAPAFLAAMKAGAGALAEITKKMGSAKTAAAIYAKLMDTVAGRTDIFKSAVEGLKIELFDAIKPVVKQDLKDATGLVNGMMRAVKRGGPVIRAIFGAIGDVFRFTFRVVQDVFGGIGGSFGLLTKAGKMTKKSINDVVGPLVLSITVIKLQVLNLIEGFIKGLKAGWISASSGIFLVVGGIWKVVLALGTMFGYFEKGSSTAKKLGQTLGWVVGVFAVFAIAKLALLIPSFIIGSVVGFVTAIKAISTAIWSSLIPAEAAATTATKGLNLSLLANPIGLVVIAMVGAAALIYKYWNPIKAFFGSLWDSIMGKGGTTASWLGKVFTILPDIIVGSINLASQAIGELVGGTIGGIKKLLTALSYVPGAGTGARLALAALESSAFKKAFGAATIAQMDDKVKAFQKKHAKTLTEKHLESLKNRDKKTNSFTMPKLNKKELSLLNPANRIKKGTKFKIPARPRAGLQASTNSAQQQTRANMSAQSQQVQNSSVRTIKHFNFSKGAITINTQVKDAEQLAKELFPVLQRIEDDQERRGIA